MTALTYIAPTKRKKIDKRKAAKLFLLHGGICCNCGNIIRDGEEWFIEHPDALILGGADDDANRKPAHVKCKAAKDAVDAAARAKRDTNITRGWQRDDAERPKMRGRPFAPARPKRRATTPLTKPAAWRQL